MLEKMFARIAVIRPLAVVLLVAAAPAFLYAQLTTGQQTLITSSRK